MRAHPHTATQFMLTNLAQRRILVGVTGGIAAYKTASLIRQLTQAGAEVRVVMTQAATTFVGPLTYQALSGHPVHIGVLDAQSEAAMDHITLARWPDAMAIAPASADFLARLAHGHANDLLTTLCLASTAPLLVAPAMNHIMWTNAATQANCQQLLARGVRLLGPDSGSQACGESGEGRMREPEQLLRDIAALFDGGCMQGLRVMVTAGPTREPIDPVRVISNRSSGKMGFAIAAAAAQEGAAVTLISGPVALATPSRVRRQEVETAQDMHAAVLERLAECDVLIAAAAVADYRPRAVSPRKIKKQADAMNLELVRNPDILAEVSRRPKRPFTVGFAAETENLESHARVKLDAKSLDLIAANLVSGPRSALEVDEAELLVLWRGGQTALPRAPKRELAFQLVKLIAERLHAKES